MRFHFAGKFNGDESTLPQREHHKNAVPFKEPEYKRFVVIINIVACVIRCVLGIPFVYCSIDYISFANWDITLGFLLGLLCTIPHEFVHAICFKEDVYMYTKLKDGVLFVVGLEDMSKTRFIVMSLLPSILFGFIPFGIWLFNHSMITVGVMGIFGISSAAGDFANVYNALRQMPKGAKTYLCGFHSYWYKED